jgi:hypothetical protein
MTITNTKKRTAFAKTAVQGVRAHVVVPFVSTKKATKLVIVEGEKRIELNGRQVNALIRIITATKRAASHR